MRSVGMAVTLLLALGAAGAACAEPRPFCADRPGRGSPPCVLDAGRLQVEMSALDATHDRQGGVSTDTSLYGDLALRLGITGHGEAQLAFSPAVVVHQKSPAGASRTSGHGDLTFAWRQSLSKPDGSGLSVALQPFVTAPTANHGLGAGGWEGGLAAPAAADLGHDVGLAVTPQLAAVRNAAQAGVHLQTSAVVGLNRALGAYSLGVELYAQYDADPAGHSTQETLDLMGAWSPPALEDTQFDAGLNAGLDRDAPDYELYVGVAHRF